MNFRRYYVANSVVFITQVVQGRTPIFWDRQYFELLLSTLRRVRVLHPFAMLGYVVLPDHFHMLIRPTGKSNFSQVMHSLKFNFTRAYKEMLGIATPLKFWQKRFWDHVVRDEADFARHLDYIHYNPVKHGLVRRPEDWEASSFLTWKKRGVYPDGWGWSEVPLSLRSWDGPTGE